jgi:hypothetical protein
MLTRFVSGNTHTGDSDEKVRERDITMKKQTEIARSLTVALTDDCLLAAGGARGPRRSSTRDLDKAEKGESKKLPAPLTEVKVIPGERAKAKARKEWEDSFRELSPPSPSPTSSGNAWQDLHDVLPPG